MTLDDVQKDILMWLQGVQERQGHCGVPEYVNLTPATFELLGEPKLVFGMHVNLVRKGSD